MSHSKCHFKESKVCLITGASRGIGRGIALQLVTNGATCYITGRNIEKLVMVQKEGQNRCVPGICIPVECDHSNDESVAKLFARISAEQAGQLDLLVNNAYSAVQFLLNNHDKPFWDQTLEGWDTVNKVGLRNNYLCAVHASRMMIKRRQGLIVNISSVGGKMYFQIPAYGIGKAGLDRMAKDCAVDLAKYNVAFVSLWPGIVKTELFEESLHDSSLTQKRATQLNWFYSVGESTEYSGKCIAHLLLDKDIMKKSGQILLSTDIGLENDFNDVNGQDPLSCRSLKFLLGVAGMYNLSNYVPRCLRISKSMFMRSLTSSTANTPFKLESEYA
ncbi:dehydrogenase/reductase SDR family member 1-like isoform X2 [Clavelina lepadiformis]|uniref:dehydrogenase/reductase SDR family member 1-like isoform X2 n=1 Tax=Clavelina lepadiformis TaxID=159417 RepID=UPI004042B8E2